MKKSQVIMLLVVALLWSCNKDDDTNPNPSIDNPINFAALEVGQKSTYLFLAGKQYFDADVFDNFEYTQDTLVLEIVGTSDEDFIVKESISPGSAVRNGVDNNWIEAPETAYFYLLHVSNDELQFKAFNTNSLTSRLFLETQSFPLENLDNEAVTIKGWKVDTKQCECTTSAFTKDYELFGQTYPHLNIFFNNEPMIVDGPGYTFIYQKEAGLVRFSTYSPWTSEGAGWDLLP